jgi:hypothetical protein
MHALRRGFGCYYAARVPAQVLQKLMRHSNISVTMDYYANVDSAVEDAVRSRHAGEQPNALPNTAPSAVGCGSFGDDAKPVCHGTSA